MNQFFVDLAAHSRTHPEAELSVWWSERTTARRVTGQLARPERRVDRARSVGVLLAGT